MLIVLEGCDGSGKTTLAKKLAEVMNAEVIHCTQFTPNNYIFFHNIIEASKTRNIIADRFCYGQFVYQEEQDRPLSISLEGTHTVVIGNDVYEVPNRQAAVTMLNLLETEMLEAGATVIHVVADPEDIRERLDAREETIMGGTPVEDIIAKFRGTFNCSILNVKEWNTSEV